MKKKSQLQENPKSQVLEHGYINIYSKLNPKERHQHNFKTLYKKLNPSWDETMVFLSNEFKKYIKPDLVVLDAGCGNGNYIIDENRKEISWAVGVDVSDEFVSKNICLDEIKIANLELLPFENNSFDVVISLWVVEHLKHPEKVFSEIHRVLKPGGVFMFATPNSGFLPLIIINALKSSGINTFLNKKLFGRQKEAIFKTHYKANTIKGVKDLSVDKSEIEILKLNYDPSYTSFNNFTFKISNWLHKLFSNLGFSFTYAHLTGVLRKK